MRKVCGSLLRPRGEGKTQWAKRVQKERNVAKRNETLMFTLLTSTTLTETELKSGQKLLFACEDLQKKKNMLLLWGNQLVQPQQISRVLCVSALKFVPSIKAYAFQNICSLLLCGKQIWFSVIGCQSKKKKNTHMAFFFFGATFKMSFCSFDEMKVSAKCHKCKGKLLLF